MRNKIINDSNIVHNSAHPQFNEKNLLTDLMSILCKN